MKEKMIIKVISVCNKKCKLFSVPKYLFSVYYE